MTPYLTCEAAAALLDAFVDHELPLAEQVTVESHLRWCRVCDARVEEMRLVGAAMRGWRNHMPADSTSTPDLSWIQSSVLTRLRAEHDQSMRVRVRGLFDDMRLFWPALGATVAVVTCLFGALNVFVAATADQSRESLAGIIDILANPGSDENPISLGGGRLSAPRALDADAVLDLIDDDEVVYALSAVVTKEGRVSNSEFLSSERVSRPRRNAPEAYENVPALLEAAKRSRFEPAQNEAGSAVAVNLVWLVARTTVKGSARFEFAPLREPRPRVVAPDPRPVEVTPGRQIGGSAGADLPAV